MKLKFGRLRFSQVVLLSIAAIVTVFLMSLNAYATSPADEDKQFLFNQNINNIQTTKNADTGLKSSLKSNTDSSALPQQNRDIENATYPTSFDLRNVGGKNYVSPVKFQNPWGSCWAFAIMSAAESSILSSQHKSFEEYNVDLSEHHLTWFTRTHLPAQGEEGYTGDPQAGEGIYCDNPMGGGHAIMGTSSFGGGIGPVSESYAPYKGVVGRVISKLNKEYESAEAAIAAGDTPSFYSKNDDWSLPESMRLGQLFKLQESNILPDPKPLSDGYGGYTLNEKAIAKYKNEIQEGKGLAITYKADSTPSVYPDYYSPARYINTKTWSQYTWEEGKSGTHGVEIIGWDDNYDKSNFTIAPCKWDAYEHGIYQLNDIISGKELKNDSDGNPIYFSSSEKSYTIKKDDIQYLLDSTGKKDENNHEIYKGKTKFLNQNDTVFENDAQGNQYFPNGKKDRLLSQDYYIYAFCQAVKDNTVTPPGNGAWICKNSWGANSNAFPHNNNWGNEGFFYLSYYDLSICRAETFEFSTYNKEAGEDYSLAFGYDNMPLLSASGCKCSTNDYSQYSFGNQFAVDQDTVINYVSCNTSEEGSTVKFDVYVQNQDTTNPLDGELVSSKTQTFTYSGYHRVKLDNDVYVPAGKKFCVVCQQTFNSVDNTTGETKSYFALPISAGFNETCPQKIAQGYYSKAVVNKDESFVIYNKNQANGQTVQDWKDYLKSDDFIEVSKEYFEGAVRSELDIDNVCVKAYGYWGSAPQPQPSDDINPVETASTSDSTPISVVLLICIALFATTLVSYRLKNN